MSKVPMKRVFIAGLNSDRKEMLKTLQRAGVVEIKSEEIVDDDLKTMDVIPEKASFDKYKNQAEQALEILDSVAPDTSAGLFASFEGAKDISKDEYEERVKNVLTSTMKKVASIISLSRQIAEDRASIPKAENKILSLEPWTGLDLPMNYSGTEHTAVFIGSLKNEVALDDIYKRFYEADAELEKAREIEREKNTNVKIVNLDEKGNVLSSKTLDKSGKEINALEQLNADISVIGSSKEMTCIMVVCLKEDRQRTEDALKMIDFSRAGLSDKIPQEEIESLRKQIEAYNRDISECENKIKAYAESRDDIKLAADYYAMRSVRYEVLSKLPQSESAFFINGFVPANYAEPLKEKIEKEYDAYIELNDPNENDDVPVALSNGFLADPMETVVESYSLPNNSEIDTSGIIALFYYIFFGLMLSDAGYGLLLTLGTGILLLKVKNMQTGMKKLMKLFFFSGISTIFWGFMFGSFFGDSVKVIAQAFFGVENLVIPGFTVPIWFEPVSEPMRMLVFAFALGIVHLFTGLGVKGYLALKQKDVETFICDVVFWAMFVGGGIVYLLSMDMIINMMGLSFKVGPLGAKVASIVAIAGALGVVFTGGRESKSWAKRLMKGAYAAYGVTGWLSDVLSYSRLLALGLATGVIAQVFNKMGSMLGATWYGILIFVIVFLVGHVLNLAINVLGAYVHTNRLQFVEFFGKFYEGGGKPYEPFTEKTKYYNVKEEK